MILQPSSTHDRTEIGFSLSNFNLWKIYCVVIFTAIAAFSLFAFAVFPTLDDYRHMSIYREEAVNNIFEAIITAIRYSISITANRVSGTFAHFIVKGLAPSYFSLTLLRVALFIIYWFYVFSIYIFIRTLSRYIFKLDKHIVLCVSLTIAFLSINGTPSTATTFFWWSAAINFPLIFSSILCFFAIVADLYYNDKLRVQGKIARHFLAFCFLFLVNGSQTSGALLLNCVLFLICFFHAWKSIREKLSFNKVFLYILLPPLFQKTRHFNLNTLF